MMTEQSVDALSARRDLGELSVIDEIEATRARALLLISAGSVRSADSRALLATQAALGHGSALGLWHTPQRWYTTARPALIDVDLRARIVTLMQDSQLRSDAVASSGKSLLDQAVIALTRYLLVLRIGPSTTGRKRNSSSLSPRVVAHVAYGDVTPIFAIALGKWFQSMDRNPPESSFLSILKLEDLDALSPNQRETAMREIGRMHALHDRDCWDDVPKIAGHGTLTNLVAGPAEQVVPEKRIDSHRPLPDDYVTEMAQKSVWLFESLGPNLLDLAQRIKDIWSESDNASSAETVQNRRRHLVAKLLREWEWKDANGARILTLPFKIKMPNVGRKRRSEAPREVWPPRSLSAVLSLLGYVQAAHLFIVSLSTGGRKSETLDLRRHCVRRAGDGRPFAGGRTFKLVRPHDGEFRDWVLPDLAVTAIEQQCRLVSIVETIGRQMPRNDEASLSSSNSDHLWLQVSGGAASNRNKPLINLDTAMRSYANALGMDVCPGNQNLRPHRFRKTVARLVALALTQAPKVLMDVFGHNAIEMTLYYILSDKALQGDIERVSRELRVMRAAEAVEIMVEAEDSQTDTRKLGGYGGPAALMLNQAIQVRRGLIHQRGEEWDAASVRELAEILTLQGKAWEVVRRGVVCTKFTGSEAGPCNNSRGRPEPARCHTSCQHRLEEPFVREDVEGALASSLEELAHAIAVDDELMQAMWIGQVRAHIGRFEDIRIKWMSNNLVQLALASHNKPSSRSKHEF